MKFLMTCAAALFLSTSLFAGSPSRVFHELEPEVTEVMTASDDYGTDEFATCKVTVDIKITDNNGITTTYQGTITVPMSCADLIKAAMA